MAKKKRAVKKISSFHKEVNKFERELHHEIDDAEKWMKARKKFFIKLAWVAGLIILFLILSHFYLSVRGVGV